MSTIVEALGGNPGETIVEAIGVNPGETIVEAKGGQAGETIVEAIGGNPGETIVEALGGNPGETIADVIESVEKSEQNPEPIIKYTISFNANGGTGTIDPIEVIDGSSITLPNGSSYIAPEGKEFIGWAKSASAQSATVESPFTPDKNIELFAVWTNIA